MATCRGWLWVLAAFLAVASAGKGEVAPPFGLEWGGSPARLVDWAKRFELDLLVRAPGKDPEMSVLMISPADGNLPGHEASSLEARFREARLFEVGVHYSYPGQTVAFVEARFLELKRLLALKHGDFRLNGRQKDIKDGVVTSSEAYHLEPSPGYFILLAKTAVTDKKRGDKAVRFSVIYHSDHHEKPLREQAATSAPPPDPE